MKLFRIITVESLVVTLEAKSLTEALTELREAGYNPLKVVQIG